MGMYKHLSETWKKPELVKSILKGRMIKWRKEESVVREDKPFRLDRARALGYKAKKGYVISRVKVLRGGKKRERPLKHGRRSKRATSRKTLKINYRTIAEQRANRKFRNLEVLNSYFLAKDGKHYWFEIILVDPMEPSIFNDRKINWICSSKHRGRVYRGLTSAGRKGRGLLRKGKGAEKLRPSLRAHKREGN